MLFLYNYQVNLNNHYFATLQQSDAKVLVEKYKYTTAASPYYIKELTPSSNIKVELALTVNNPAIQAYLATSM